MITATIDEIRQDLLGYLQRVQQGEVVVILEADKPVAEITPIASRAAEPRPYGLCAGEFYVPEGFDDPLPEEIVRQFEGP